MALITGLFCTSWNCFAAICSQHVPEAYLKLVIAPTLLYELQAFGQAQGPLTFAVQCRFPTTISSVSRGIPCQNTWFSLAWKFSSPHVSSMPRLPRLRLGVRLRLTRARFDPPPLIFPWQDATNMDRCTGQVVLAMESTCRAWNPKDHLSPVTAVTPKGFSRVPGY